MRRRAIGPVGTTARALTGAGLLTLAALGPWAIQRRNALLGLVGVPAAVVGAHALRARATGGRMCATSGHPAICVAVAAGVGLWIASPPALLLFLGSNMTLAAVRGTAGCEVLALGNWVLRRDDVLSCLIFSPIDLLEAGLRERPLG